MENEKLVTNFIKSPDFRTDYVSGIFGGITPHAQISMVHFIERAVLPTKIEYSVEPSTGSVNEIGRESKLGIVREVQGSLIMDLHMAKSMVEWLNEKITLIEQQTLRK